MNNNDTHPFGYWITAVDRLLKAEFATVFADEGVTRREWRMLNIIDGTIAPRVPGRPLRGPKLHRLIELGWIERAEEGWSLTEAGRRAKARLGTAVDEMRTRVAGAVTPEEYATMTASLEKIAREFGWEEGKPLPRSSRRHRRGFGNGHGHGHGGHGRGFGHGHGGGEERGDHGHRHHDDDERGGHGHRDHDHDHDHDHDGHGHHDHRGHGRRVREHHIHVHTH